MPHARVAFVRVEEPAESVRNRAAGEGIGIAGSAIPVRERAVRQAKRHESRLHFRLAEEFVAPQSFIPLREIVKVAIDSAVAQSCGCRTLIGLNYRVILS